MRSDWQRKKLREVCTLDKLQGTHADLPYIGMEDIESQTGRFLGSNKPQEVKSSTFRFTSEHILYGRLRPYLNKVYLPNFEGRCSTEIFPIKPGESISREYLSYWFLMESTVNRINATCTGARMPRANMDAVLDFDLLLPPQKEQQRIVAILDEAFEGIATATANAEKNLQNARELFESTLQSVFAEKGEGWVEKRLGDSVKKVSTGPFGSLLHKSDYVSEGVPLVNPINIVNDVIVPDPKKMVNADTQKRLQTYLLNEGDIVIARRGEIGRCAVVTEEQSGWICGTGCFFIKPSSELNPNFLVRLLRSSSYREMLEAVATGATMKNISNKALSELLVTFPSYTEQTKILDRINELDADIQRLESIYKQKIVECSELKQSILQKAFAGELH